MHSSPACLKRKSKQNRLLPLIASIFISAPVWYAVAAVKAEPAGSKPAGQQKFSASAWRQAVNPGSDWSRVELARDFYKEFKPVGMERKRVIELLGEPTLSTENRPQAKDRTFLDQYMLSAKNKESLRIDYDSSNKVSSAMFEGPCQTWIFCPAGPVVKPESLNKLLASGLVNGSLKEIERTLGKAHMQSLTKNLVGGQYWANFTYVWRLNADGRRTFGVYGHKPYRDYRQAGAATYSGLSSFIQTMSADCPHVSQPPDTIDDLPPRVESSNSSNAKR